MRLKKLFLYAIVLINIGLVACRKNYTCTCTVRERTVYTRDPRKNTNQESTTIATYKDIKKKRAKELCTSYDTKKQSVDSVYFETYNSCTLVVDKGK